MTKCLFIFLFIPFIANAQFTKGDKFIGGSVNLTAQNNGGNGISKMSNFSVNPQVGFLLSGKFALGGSLSYLHTKSELFGLGLGNKNVYNSFGAGVFIRNYFPLGEKFVFAIHSGVDYGRGKMEYVSGGLTMKSEGNIFTVGVKPVFIFFPTNKWG